MWFIKKSKDQNKWKLCRIYQVQELKENEVFFPYYFSGVVTKGNRSRETVLNSLKKQSNKEFFIRTQKKTNKKISYKDRKGRNKGQE